MQFSNEQFFIVTGASSGIGRAIALKLNAEGACVIAIARSIDKLIETKKSAIFQKSFFIEQKNLTENIENLPNFVTYLKSKYGKLTGLVCVAGINNVSTIQMFNHNDIQETFTLNYEVPLFLTKGFSDRRNNIGEGANILFIASISGVSPEKGQGIYGASKAALIAASKAISKELGPRKIRCNCISPAWVKTQMLANQQKNIDINFNDYTLGIGEPNDVANLATYLLSDRAKWITGQNYILDGGKM